MSGINLKDCHHCGAQGPSAPIRKHNTTPNISLCLRLPVARSSLFANGAPASGSVIVCLL